jgi:carboxypeptidase PM20D1
MKLWHIITAVVGVIVLVLAVAIIRGLTVEPLPPYAPAAVLDDLPSVDGDAAAKQLAEAIRFETISYDKPEKATNIDRERATAKGAALDAMHTWLEGTYPDFHKAATKELVGKSLVYTWPGSDPSLPPVLLMAHLDVVPVVAESIKEWTHPPFAGEIADGFVWGRGALDTKGSLVCMLYAADRLAAEGFKPARTIIFAFGEDEEIGGAGNQKVADLFKSRGTKLAWVLDEGGAVISKPLPGMDTSVAFVNVAEKGYLTLELTARGTPGHSSAPSDDLAVARLAKAVTAVVEHPFDAGLDDVQRRKLGVLAPYAPFAMRLAVANLWLTEPLVVSQMKAQPLTGRVLHTTIAPTMLSAGVKENVIPPTATATVNFRLHARDTVEGVIDHVKHAIDDERVDVRATTHAALGGTDPANIDGEEFKFLARTIQRTFGPIPVAPDVMPARTDSRYFDPLAAATFRFWPFDVVADDAKRVHGTDERLAVSNMKQGVTFYMRLMKDLR